MFITHFLLKFFIYLQRISKYVILVKDLHANAPEGPEMDKEIESDEAKDGDWSNVHDTKHRNLPDRSVVVHVKRSHRIWRTERR